MFITITKKQLIKFIVAPICIAVIGISFFFCYSAYVSSSPRPTYTVVLDAGHGGMDGGSSGVTTNVQERDLNLIIAKKVESYLRAMGVGVVQTRSNENGLYGVFASGFKMADMKERAKIINKANPDLVVSIHMNFFTLSSSRGAQVFFPPKSEVSKAIAIEMQRLFVSNLPNARTSPLVGDYYILQCSSAPSVLVECGFLSNPEEERLLQTSEYQEKLSYQIFCGIMHFFDIYK